MTVGNSISFVLRVDSVILAIMVLIILVTIRVEILVAHHVDLAITGIRGIMAGATVGIMVGQ